MTLDQGGNRICIISQNNAFGDLPQQEAVHQQRIKPETNCECQVPRLCRISPYLELEAMGTQLLKVFLLGPSQLLFHIISAMVIIEKQIVHSRCRKH